MSEDESDGADFRQAAIEHLDALYGYAMALTRNETEAQDLVQETYLRAVRAFGQLMPDSNLKGWLFAICRNIRLNQLRHARSGPRFVELDAEEEGRAEWFDSAASNFHYHTINGLKVITWSDRGLTYALVSDLEERGQQSCMVCHAGTKDRDFIESLKPRPNDRED